MKTETIKRRMSPTGASLRELPEIDFTKYRIRRNPYAGRIKREGVKVVHDAPSAEFDGNFVMVGLSKAGSGVTVRIHQEQARTCG
jgi:hypothetical protein